MVDPCLQQTERTRVIHGGRKLIYFGGCDYFRFSSHPAVAAALKNGLKQYGLNVAASRRTTGNHRLYERLEQRLARFFGVPDALLFSSGYLADLAVAQSFAGRFSHALLDERAHPALQDAAAALNCPVLSFAHRDAMDLGRCLDRLGKFAKPIVLTDGVFSADGALAPLDDFLRLLPRDGAVLLDDAHGAGTLGVTGRGTLEALGVRDRRILRTITLSKAFGTFGGALLGTRSLCRLVRDRSRVFMGSTPVPLPLAAATLKALDLLHSQPGLPVRLSHNVNRVKSGLRTAGFVIPESPAPIVSITPAGPRAVSQLKRLLLARRIYPSFIRYPGGPEAGYFRFAISSEHTGEQLDLLLDALLTFARTAPRR